MSKYNSVSIPEDLIETVDKFVKSSSLGYKSVAEFIKEAIRNQLRRDNNKGKK